MLDVQSLENSSKKLLRFIVEISLIITFTIEVDFEKWNNYSTSKCWTWKGTTIYHVTAPGEFSKGGG